MKRIIHPSATNLSVSCMAALVVFSGCDQGPGDSGDLEDRVRVAELERDAMKDKIEKLRAIPAGETFPGREAELVVVEEELKTARAANVRIREEITDFKKNFPMRGENTVGQ
jgi:hypothetical protein